MSDHIREKGRTRDGREFIIRRYRRLDRERVRFICSETGFVGDPQEAIFIGREIFADLWSSYWTDREPENAFVAEVGGKVEGYILGCLDTLEQEKTWTRRVLPGVAARMAKPSWWKHPVNRTFIKAMVRSQRWGELDLPVHEIAREYPAHLHTNIADPSLRGQRIGGAMMRVLLGHLGRSGARGVHLGTTSHNRQAVPFYERFGFEKIFERRVTCYDHAIGDPPLSMIYMAKKLAP